jgi:hypothetical protein
VFGRRLRPFGGIRIGAVTLAPAVLPVSGHYVAPDGNATWAQSTALANPCAPLTAFQNAAAGDTVYFRGGVYTIPHNSAFYPSNTLWQPVNSGVAGNPITFCAYPAELPILDGVVPLNGTGTDFATYIGSYPDNQTDVLAVVNQDYITIDGFSTRVNGGTGLGVPRIQVWGSTGTIIQNCDCDGGPVLPVSALAPGSYDNTSAIRFQETTDCTIRNCRLHDVRHATVAQHNVAGYLGYRNTGTIIEHVEAATCSQGLFLKGSHHDALIRYCFIHDCAFGVLVTPDTVNMLSDRLTVSHNLILNCTQGHLQQDNYAATYHGDDWLIYNNTIYGGVGAGTGLFKGGSQPGHGLKVYNNIIAECGGYGLYASRMMGLPTANQALIEEDHNQWGPGAVRAWKMTTSTQGGVRAYSSLAAWQASTELADGSHPGVGDLASNPLFVNGSGTLTLASDFALQPGSPCRGAGRNGADIGCDVSQVGVV